MTLKIELDKGKEKLSRKTMQNLAAVIRYQAYERGMSNAAIGRFWDMPRETVRDIVNGKTWRVENEDEDSVSDNG